VPLSHALIAWWVTSMPISESRCWRSLRLIDLVVMCSASSSAHSRRMRSSGSSFRITLTMQCTIASVAVLRNLLLHSLQRFSGFEYLGE